MVLGMLEQAKLDGEMVTLKIYILIDYGQIL